MRHFRLGSAESGPAKSPVPGRRLCGASGGSYVYLLASADVGDVKGLVNALCAFEEAVRAERGPDLKAAAIGGRFRVARAALT
jgi:hypothetical protein